ncbi:hypothetical protein GR168_23080 (plasmid) [Gordonia sp. JH63]|uniref:hypothetical protein n=1 Tax=Gordonia sp. JH63 TaxID=2698900 RepID=UPI0013201724|nr:hypothetical protein [Gordonia sp. JH63]QHD88384.1 hypothetical protein GR168_23080 [Gordonia sp. JH63]
MTNVESWRAGFTQGLEPLQSDDEFLEVLGAYTARNWKPIERVGEVEVRMNDIDIPPEGLIAVVTYQRAAPPFWGAHFRGKVAESGLRYGGGQGGGSRQTDKFRLDSYVDTDVRRIAEVVDASIDYANDTFRAE